MPVYTPGSLARGSCARLTHIYLSPVCLQLVRKRVHVMKAPELATILGALALLDRGGRESQAAGRWALSLISQFLWDLDTVASLSHAAL